ncbi:MAG: beta strand repeat-containing protein, partial [Solirubrobacteraceae bacterium]
EVCIAEAGTYTVEMTQTSTTVTVAALTIGAGSGTQTLAVGSSGSLNAVLTTSAGISNGAHGAITMTNGDTAANSVTLVGPITNAGLITTEPAHGGSRTLQSNLTNTGTLQLNANTTYNGTSDTLTNEGQLNLAEAKQLTVSNKGAVANGTGGKIAPAAGGDVLMEPGTSFTEGAGTTSGAKPVIVRDAALTYSGSGASAISTRGESATVSGNVSSGQSLAIESTGGENAKTTASASFTNAGSITLTNADASANSATLVVSSGTLTNSGTLTTEPAAGGNRTIQANVTNTGTLQINASTAFNGSSKSLTNEGALNLAEAKQLTLSEKSSFTNGSGGKIVATGSAVVLMEPGTSFTEGAGTTSGTKPVIVRDAALSYTGSGASAIAIHGENGTLSGTLSAGQSLAIESTSTEHAKTTVTGGFTNAGSITLTNGDGSANNATLLIASGTLSNSGTITTQPGVGGSRTIQGSITNTGTLAINANTTYNGKAAALINEGTINLAEGKALTVSNEGSVSNAAGGKITATGSGDVFMEPTTSFTEGAGTTSGTKPVIVRDGALSYTGSGSSTIAIRGENGTLSGTLSAGQSLLIESTSTEHAKVTVTGGFTNAGSITLTNGDGSANNATLLIASGTLSNSGTITTEVGVGGQRILQGNITNTGKLVFNANTSDPASLPTLLNSGAIDIANGVTFSVPSKPTVSNESGGLIAATGTGVLSEGGGTFNQGLGKTTGSLPVVIDDGALHVTGKGTGAIALRGESTLSGTINAGQTVSIQSTCTEHAKTTAAGSFLNSGTVTLTNGDGCGNNATLNLAGGTLENKGTLSTAYPHGGTRTIEGNVKNEKTLSLGAGSALKVTGTFMQGKKGQLKTEIVSGASFGALAVSASSTLDGTLWLAPIKTFFGKAGESFAVLSSSSRTGTFAKEKSAAVKKAIGLYYKPTYSAGGVTLVVTQSTLVLTPAAGLPASTITISGVGYLPGDTVKLTFTDHKGVKTTLPGAPVNGSGEVSAEVTVPAGAAEGAAKVAAKTTQTGVSITKAFTVT